VTKLNTAVAMRVHEDGPIRLQALYARLGASTPEHQDRVRAVIRDLRHRGFVKVYQGTSDDPDNPMVALR
jgi:hypothetical protein